MLGDWSNTDVPRRYAISSVPAYVLIDPQGRILASEYSLEVARRKVERSLQKADHVTDQDRKAAGGRNPRRQCKSRRPIPKRPKPTLRRPKQPKRWTLRTHGQMRVEVVDDAGKPVADAVVRVEAGTVDDLEDKRAYQCDSHGRTTVELPKTVSGLRLSASKPGFCAEQKSFWPKNRTDHSFIADEHRFRLVRPIPIGGIVKDDEGRMIAGARLRFFDPGAYRNIDAICDAQGHWRLDARPDRGTQLNSVTHPDYLANYLCETRTHRSKT